MDVPAMQGGSELVLLTLPTVEVFQVFEGQKIQLGSGGLALECVSLPRNATAPLVSASGKTVRPNPFSDDPCPDKDLYLIIKVGPDFEMCLIPGVQISRDPGFEAKQQTGLDDGVTLRIPSPSVPNAFCDLIIHALKSEEDQQDLETLEILLKQYGSLNMPDHLVNRDIPGTGLIDSRSPPSGAVDTKQSGTASPRPGLQRTPTGGRVVLVEESSGQVLGELSQNVPVEEQGRVDSTHEPVVIDFGPLEQGYLTQVTVKRVDEADMDDWMLRGAHYLSRGILAFGNKYSSGVTSAAEYYVKHVTPNAEPSKLSDSTKSNIRMVHNTSARGLKVTRKTLDTVHDAIGGFIARTASSGMQSYDQLTAPNSRRPSRPASPGARQQASSAGGHQQPSMGPAPPSYQAVTGSNDSYSYGGGEKTGKGGAALDPHGYPVDKKPGEPDPTQHPAVLASDGSNNYDQSGYSETGTTMVGPDGKKQPKPFLLRALQAAEVIGTSVEATTASLIESTTNAASTAAGHKYGPEAGQAAKVLGGSVRNVALVYVDVRGVGRKTIIKSGRKGISGAIKTRLATGEEVEIKPEELQLAGSNAAPTPSTTAGGGGQTGVAKGVTVTGVAGPTGVQGQSAGVAGAGGMGTQDKPSWFQRLQDVASGRAATTNEVQKY